MNTLPAPSGVPRERASLVLAAGRATAWMLLTAVLHGCKPSPEDLTPGAVAQVGSRIIPSEALSLELQRRGAAARDASEAAARRKEALDALIDEEALVQRALASGLDRDPEIQRRYRRLLVGELRQRTLETAAKQAPTEEELRAWYEAHADQFLESSESRGALVSIRLPRNATPEMQAIARSRLEEARTRIESSDRPDAAFAECVRGLSDDPSTRRLEGDTGWVKAGSLTRWPELVVRTLAELATPGALSPVLATPEAVYLIRLTDRKAARRKPFEEVRARVEQRVVALRAEREEKNFVAESRRAVEIRENPVAVASVPVPSAPPQLALTPPSTPGSASAPSSPNR